MNIAALLSGGVDSSVVVHLLNEAGYKPTLFYIKIGMDDDELSLSLWRINDFGFFLAKHKAILTVSIANCVVKASEVILATTQRLYKSIIVQL